MLKKSFTFGQRQGRILFCLAMAVILGGCQTDFGHDLPYPTIRKVHFGSGTTSSTSHSPRAISPNTSNPWIPPARLEEKGRWQGIVVHHSALDSGSAQSIDRLHKNKGWDGLGYHFVISNGLGAPNGKVTVG